MKTLNSFAIAGNLGKDAIVINTPNSNIARCSVAFTKKDMNSNEKKTVWVEIKAWSKDATTFEILKKGKMIQFTGFFDIDSYKKDDKEVTSLVFIAQKWEKVNFQKE